MNPGSQEIHLPHGYVTVISEEDWPLVESLTLYRGSDGYVYFSRWIDGKVVSTTLHGWMMNAPSGTEVDHINGDRLDNRRENLRVVSRHLNQVNRHKLSRNNKSGVRGVTVQQYKTGTSYIAQIVNHGEYHYLGSFGSLEEAAKARRAAELYLYGELCP